MENELHHVPQSILNAIKSLGDKLIALNLCDNNPCYNVGEKYETDKFALRSYCWCEGDIHKEENGGCPPNFEFGKIKIRWYKHYERGVDSEVEITPELEVKWLKMIWRLIDSLQPKQIYSNVINPQIENSQNSEEKSNTLIPPAKQAAINICLLIYGEIKENIILDFENIINDAFSKKELNNDRTRYGIGFLRG